MAGLYALAAAFFAPASVVYVLVCTFSPSLRDNWLICAGALIKNPTGFFAHSSKTSTSLIANHLLAGSNRFVSVDLTVLKAMLPVYTSHKLP